MSGFLNVAQVSIWVVVFCLVGTCYTLVHLGIIIAHVERIPMNQRISITRHGIVPFVLPR